MCTNFDNKLNDTEMMKRGSVIANMFLAITLSLTAGNRKNSLKSGDFKMAVVSDIHIMAPELLQQDGAAFDSYVTKDRKMLKESAAILKQFTSKILDVKPQLVLISGDLTKDGEYVSHRYLVDSCLSTLKAAGIQVLVIPGNHDINNPHAVSFHGDTVQRVRTVSPQDFLNIYQDYGYKDAIARDTYSLSYVSQPFDSLRILAIDACKYEQNNFKRDISVTGGRIKPGTMNFIRKQVADAHKKGIPIFAMMHHGLVQHWDGQGRLMKDYLVDNWKHQANAFAEMGLKVVFTGHSHAQDVAKHRAGKSFVYDIETGSTVTYPCPYRLLTLNEDSVSVNTEYIDTINYDLQGLSFQEYAKRYVEEGVRNAVKERISNHVPDSVKEVISEIFTKTMIAHYSGDERLLEKDKIQAEVLYDSFRKVAPLYARYFQRSFDSIWNDGNLSDKNLIISLNQLQ